MTQTGRTRRHVVHQTLDARLSAYLVAAAATGVAVASKAEAGVVQDLAEQPFGVNGDVNIDFNADGQTDFQIDHDRVNVSGNNLDYLQLDKNDVSSPANPIPINPFATFPPGTTTANNTATAGYVIDPNVIGSYPAGLNAGTLIGPLSSFDFSEGDNFQGNGTTIRANRLLDEDATQIDVQLGGLTPAQVQVPFNGPNFDGLAGQVRYLGVKMELNGSGQTNYGWIGIRIDNEADATGAVVGYGYETLPGVEITAGPIPEPGSLMMVAIIAGCCLRRRFMRGARR